MTNLNEKVIKKLIENQEAICEALGEQYKLIEEVGHNGNIAGSNLQKNFIMLEQDVAGSQGTHTEYKKYLQQLLARGDY